MARPKKSPRERLQITLPKPRARQLRAFARKGERELSEVVSTALGFYFDMNGLNPERMREYDAIANRDDSVKELPPLPINPDRMP